MDEIYNNLDHGNKEEDQYYSNYVKIEKIHDGGGDDDDDVRKVHGDGDGRGDESSSQFNSFTIETLICFGLCLDLIYIFLKIFVISFYLINNNRMLQ